jgi:hypothetical protein
VPILAPVQLWYKGPGQGGIIDPSMQELIWLDISSIYPSTLQDYLKPWSSRYWFVIQYPLLDAILWNTHRSLVQTWDGVMENRPMASPKFCGRGRHMWQSMIGCRQQRCFKLCKFVQNVRWGDGEKKPTGQTQNLGKASRICGLPYWVWAT